MQKSTFKNNILTNIDMNSVNKSHIMHHIEHAWESTIRGTVSTINTCNNFHSTVDSKWLLQIINKI